MKPGAWRDALAALALFSVGAGQAVADGSPIRGAHYPALSADGSRLCFSYQGDLWVCSSEGGTARRLTVHAAYDMAPKWSPDGNWIAFSSNRENTYDLFIIPSKGGAARQMTFHSADDILCDWSADGSRLLFSSARDGTYPDLYTITVTDGGLKKLTKDRSPSRYASFSSDGKEVAYVRGGQSWWRPKYRGSNNSEIYTVDTATGSTKRVTNDDGFQSWPVYAKGDRELLYVAQASGVSNLFSQARVGGSTKQLTHHTADAVRFPSLSRDGSTLAYEQGQNLWVLRRSGDAGPHAVEIVAPSDQRVNPVEPITQRTNASGLSLSIDGQTLAFAARGEIWTLPQAGGDARRITKSAGQESNAVFSMDGAKMAYTTSRSGNLDIMAVDLKTLVETPLTSDRADENGARFSPDGRFIAYIRSGGEQPGLYVMPLGTAPTPSSAVDVALGAAIAQFDWSPDGRWIVYAKRDKTSTTDLWIVPTVGGNSVNITRYPGRNSSPQWSRDGKRILFSSNRGADPGAAASSLYVLDLVPKPEGDPALPGIAPAGIDGEPLIPLPDDPTDPEAQRRRPPTGGQQAGPQEPAGPGLPSGGVPPRSTDVRIDFTDIHNRARRVANQSESIGSATLSPDCRTAVFAGAMGGAPGWFALDIESGSALRLTTGPASGQIEFTQDATRFYWTNSDGTISYLQRGGPGASPLAFAAAMEMDRRSEIGEAFAQAWRSLSTQFYDANMHGTDWAALRNKYAALLPETVVKEDFAWLLQAMIGELNASHTGATPPTSPHPAPTGSLGLEFDPAYAGPGLKVIAVLPRGPGDQSGKRIDIGEYIVSIDGKDVRLNEDLYRELNGRVDKTVEVLVNSKPTREGARSVKIRPISSTANADLEYERWVTSRREKVDELSGGALAYLHIRAMDQTSLQRFQRELFGEAQQKKGLVIDVRFNGGGRIHDDLLGLLSRKTHVYETPRDGETAPQPFRVWDRPSILLINEFSASDAEIFPNGFRAYGLGKLVGVPTYGGVIGTANITLIDGTTFRIPRTGWRTLDGRNLENWGVPPDLLVEQTPQDYARGDDKQLAAAVSTLLTDMRAR